MAPTLVNAQCAAYTVTAATIAVAGMFDADPGAFAVAVARSDPADHATVVVVERAVCHHHWPNIAIMHLKLCRFNQNDNSSSLEKFKYLMLFFF